MRQYEYIVDFGDDTITVTAFNPEAAKILAQAERIKMALHYDVVGITKKD